MEKCHQRTAKHIETYYAQQSDSTRYRLASLRAAIMWKRWKADPLSRTAESERKYIELFMRQFGGTDANL